MVSPSSRFQAILVCKDACDAEMQCFRVVLMKSRGVTREEEMPVLVVGCGGMEEYYEVKVGYRVRVEVEGMVYVGDSLVRCSVLLAEDCRKVMQVLLKDG